MVRGAERSIGFICVPAEGADKYQMVLSTQRDRFAENVLPPKKDRDYSSFDKVARSTETSRETEMESETVCCVYLRHLCIGDPFSTAFIYNFLMVIYVFESTNTVIGQICCSKLHFFGQQTRTFSQVI